MTGLPRRTFLATTAALSAAWALPADLLGSALAAPPTPSQAPTTLLQTIRQRATPQNGKYRTLVGSDGEPYYARPELLGRDPDPKRVDRRRSLLYAGHLSDIHVEDPQSPARLEALEALAPAVMAGGSHPQDTLTTHALAMMVEALADARNSPLTGAPMAAVFVTGDIADAHSSLELRWCIDLLDGGSVVPNSGAPGVYDGVQIWDEATYVYHPSNPGLDAFGEYGYPTIPGYLNASVSQPVHSVGLPVPWYSLYGNHDAIYMGTIGMGPWIQTWALGDRKASTWQATVDNVMLDGWISEASAFQRFMHGLMARIGEQRGLRAVPADPRRELFDQPGFMEEHLGTTSSPGPVGHGFTQQNIQTGQTWWQTDIAPNFRLFGLDTTNKIIGADGAVPKTQFDWLKQQLAQAQSEKKICIVMSHHPSLSLENPAQPTIGASDPLIHADEFVAMLLGFPNMVAWLNGHTHTNTLTPHQRSGGGGFWEITAASLVDYPQQQRLIEFVDNRDGTMSIFTTVIDHKAPPTWTEGDFSQTGLASLGRELAANNWYVNPLAAQGSALDRNCELVLPAPFDLSAISDASLEQAHASQRARLVAYEQRGQR